MEPHELEALAQDMKTALPLLRDMHTALMGTLDRPGFATRISSIEQNCGLRGQRNEKLYKAVFGNGEEGLLDKARTNERRWDTVIRLLWVIVTALIGIGAKTFIG